MSWDDDDWENAADLTLPGAAAPPPAVAESFSDEEEVVESDDETQAMESTKPKKQGDPNKVKAKKAGKQKQKELEKLMEAEAEAARNAKPLTKEEKIAEKLRLQQLVEEADNELTNELFNAKKEEGSLDVTALQALLQSVPLTNEEEYKNFAIAVGHRIEIEDKPFLAKEFLKEVARSIGRAISGEDLAEVISILGVVKNEKVKVQLNKKKKKVGKKFANIARNDFDLDVGNARAPAAFDDELDGDFM